MIRIVLLVALIGIGAMVTFGSNTAGLRASRKLLFLTTLMAGCVAVLFPELVSDVATFLGVGRGTDLLLYVMTVMLLTVTLTGYMEKKRAERREAKVVQAMALLEAEVQELRAQLARMAQVPRPQAPTS
jgi:small membrane protein